MKLTFLTPEEIEWIDSINDPLTVTEIFTDLPMMRLGIRLDDNELVGTIILFNINTQCKKAEIGLHIFSRYGTTRGIIPAYKAMKEFIKRIFDDFDINRIYARVQSDNNKCLSCIEGMGFIYEGTERQTLLVNGVFKDVKVFSIIRNDLKKG